MTRKQRSTRFALASLTGATAVLAAALDGLTEGHGDAAGRVLERAVTGGPRQVSRARARHAQPRTAKPRVSLKEGA